MNDVIWDEAALEELADIWVAVAQTERERIEEAILRLNEKLKRAPQTEGESRSGNVRVTFEIPLTVWYRVFADIDTVIVFHLVRPLRRP